MYSIISTLDPISSEAVEQLRSLLEGNCKPLSKVHVLEPHMSWLGAEGGDLPAIADRLTDIAHSIKPIELETAGYGIFPGPEPVFYLPVITTRKLLRIHQKLWKELSTDIVSGNQQYRPDHWMPHITVFDVDNKVADDLSCAIRDILLTDFHLKFTIDQFKLAYYQNDQYGYHSVHHFS